MADIPSDLTDVGTHHGNQPPTETGQTVRSPEGPDPSTADAQPSSALFQVVRAPSEDQLKIRVHSARAEPSPPDEGEEIGTYRTEEALRKVLADANVDGWAAVFEDLEADRVLVDTDVNADHAWIGQARYSTITLFADAEAATTFAENHERPLSDR
ncbi:MAG: hypothetical protein ABEL04_09465 [Salinibacter sp.]|uniref:hypothetical protein n=1 Tax=Salinibacter sp. TaxID=2065818 RepID=UPI0035D467EC